MSKQLEELQTKMKAAMKAGEKDDVALYRSLIAAIKNYQIENKGELSDADVTKVLRKQAKQRQDSIEQYQAGDRADLVAKEQHELDLIETMLPTLMSEEQIEAVVSQAMTDLGVESASEKGKLMGAIMPKLQGKADGAMVNKVVTRLLS